MLCLFPFFTQLIATICDWSTGSTEIKRKCRIVPNEPQTEGTVEQNLKNCRHSCIYVKMQNTNVWRIHKWQLDIGTHAIGKSGSLNRIRIFFSIYWIRICFVSFIHHFPRLYLFSILSKSFFEYFYWSFTPPLMSIFVLNGLFLAVFVCGDLGPHDGTLRSSDWLFYLPCCSRFWMSNPFFYGIPLFLSASSTGILHREIRLYTIIKCILIYIKQHF
jgi:hypothetical protein